MNLGHLRCAVRQILKDEVEPTLWSDEQINRYLNNAVREACLRARLLKDDHLSKPELCRYTVAPGNTVIRLRPEVLVARSGHLGSERQKLWMVTAESMDRIYPQWEADVSCPGQAGYGIMDLSQKTIRLFPVPLAPDVLHLRVWRQPLESEEMRRDTDRPVIQLPDFEELKHWAVYECYQTREGEENLDTRAATHLATFEQRFGARPSLHEMARWADSPPRHRRTIMW
ncbi:MAG TPA: hypothetical protein VMA74_20780 [Dyella sp.]|uniref:phage adaptor protein n=1 Tax=Dyella sp. TaxID=1869338 RepID=UPI002D19D15F|nr:hypothetical protein [Dyella sp.]HUB92172.1 hypothetical protein [Dyella sp.]